MAKRFTDTDKWKDGWFIELSTNAKVLFIFLCDNCDIAGFYERSDKFMTFFLNMSLVELDNATTEIKKSVIYKSKVYFVKKFIYHQRNLPLNTNNNCHRGIIEKLIKYEDIFNDSYIKDIKDILAPSKPLARGYSKGKGNSNGNSNSKGGYVLVEKDGVKTMQKI